MDIKDVCDADHNERVNHFMNQICPGNATWSEKIYNAKQARILASQEMINEIHCMLLHLTEGARMRLVVPDPIKAVNPGAPTDDPDYHPGEG